MSGGRSAMPPAVLTIGHSNHPLDRFLALLAQNEVAALADIRRFPGSRKHPHFSRDNLAAALPKVTAICCAAARTSTTWSLVGNGLTWNS
jgi:uncharacterized protein (DUF488 family)